MANMMLDALQAGCIQGALHSTVVQSQADYLDCWHKAREYQQQQRYQAWQDLTKVLDGSSELREQAIGALAAAFDKEPDDENGDDMGEGDPDIEQGIVETIVDTPLDIDPVDDPSLPWPYNTGGLSDEGPEGLMRVAAMQGAYARLGSAYVLYE